MNKQPSVLIVDDHQPTADSLRKRLEKKHKDWFFTTVYSMREALLRLDSTEFDAVITDYRLDDHDPEKNGLKVIEKSRSLDPLCVNILMTAYPEDFDRYKDAFNKGVDECVIKSQRGVDVGEEILLKLWMNLQKRWAHEEAYHYSRHIDEAIRVAWGVHRTSLGEGRQKKKQGWLNRRHLVSMFTDIRGFTDVSHQLQMHTGTLVQCLEQLYTATIEAVSQHGGIVDKFMGDGAMCLFGALDDTQPAEEICTKAVRAALALKSKWPPIAKSLRESALRTTGTSLPQLTLGVGLHYAPDVLVGMLETDRRDQFTAIGLGVNLAKKLESYAGRTVRVKDDKTKKDKDYTYGDLLITATVEAHLNGRFEIRPEDRPMELMAGRPAYPVWRVIRELLTGH